MGAVHDDEAPGSSLRAPCKAAGVVELWGDHYSDHQRRSMLNIDSSFFTSRAWGHKEGGMGDFGTFRSCWTPPMRTASLRDFQPQEFNFSKFSEIKVHLHQAFFTDFR